MLPSEILAIAARLHVLLRRKTGRVTDTEWLAVNADYAAEIVRHCREQAATPGNEELAEWATRLEQAMAQRPPARAPLLQTAAQALRGGLPAPPPAGLSPGAPASSSPLPPGPEAPPPDGGDGGGRYVGGLR